MGARLVFPGSRLVNTLEDGVFVECEPFTPLIVRAPGAVAALAGRAVMSHRALCP